MLLMLNQVTNIYFVIINFLRKVQKYLTVSILMQHKELVRINEWILLAATQTPSSCPDQRLVSLGSKRTSIVFQIIFSNIIYFNCLLHHTF